jgi:hypothetical protein
MLHNDPALAEIPGLLNWHPELYDFRGAQLNLRIA